MAEIKIEKVYSRREEICNIISHLLGVVLILAGIPWLLNAVSGSKFSGNALAYWVMIIYSVSMLIMFSGSSAYHAAVKPVIRVNLRKVDHSAIYVQIAGTYTPLMTLGVSGKSGMIILLINWVLAFAGVISEMTGKKPFKHFSLCLYLLMGWLCVCIMPQMYKEMSVQSLIWLASGGVIYTLGVIFYVSKREFSHAIWHLFVLGGALGHWISVLLLCR